MSTSAVAHAVGRHEEQGALLMTKEGNANIPKEQER